MKFVISFLTMLLVVVNSVLLLFQYHVYSSSLEGEEQSFYYEQEIEIKFTSDRVVVKQHFINLPQEQLTISWPISSENRSCDLKISDSCSRLSDDLTSFEEGESSKQSISYEIPLVDGLTDGQLFSGFLAKIEKGGVSYTTLHITDELKRGGMWISGLPVIGTASLNLIDYTLSDGVGNISDLYWQQEIIPVKYENNTFTVHSNENLSEEVKTQLDKLNIPNSAHMTLLFTENKNNIKSSRIAFIAGKDIDSIVDEVIVKNVQLQYGLKEDSSLFAEVVSSFLMESPIGAEKSVWMYETLQNYFTASQLAEWKTALSKSHPLSAEKLDKLLSEVIDWNTSFFQLNGQAESVKFPLLLEDPRTVYVNGVLQEKMKLLMKDGKILYAAEPLLAELGYTLNDTDKGLYVQNDSRSFRFPIQEPFYVLNEKRYDAMSEPFERIGSEFYIEEAWMIRLFLLNLDKQEDRINITESTSF
ncbi:hypothetical protein [Psychrobacillus soli]|uniref:RNA polymerase II n=1 Tax=Psychrobacillus soli TaxID=1543965 RepID=A0A544SPD8_9BACI|nr:hypothetical protein [Psychrobacillus soli]TQR07073.1 hypothetical protein FG383_18370 [Psychrobacillus soli]